MGVNFAVWLAILAVIGQSNRPNIVFVLADDLGWSDLGCYGADLNETPHLDALAKRGIRFTQAYAPSPVCSPTRAALMTGKCPARLKLTVWSEQARGPVRTGKLRPADSLADLPANETTLASHLQKAGYLTAIVGKWHLGDADRAPQTFGFDINIGGTHWGAPHTYFFPYRGKGGRFGAQYRYVPGLDFGRKGEYLTDRLTDEALRVIDEAAKTPDRPFFLYLAHHAVHTPLQAKPDDVAYFKAKTKPGMKHQNAVYAAMLRSLDNSVGRLVADLEKRKLLDNAIFVFTSDNGGFIGKNTETGLAATNNAPLRSGKGCLYEGGIRVPLIAVWPKGDAGARVCECPVVLTDWFPTLLAETGLPLDSKVPCDGVRLQPLLRNPADKLARQDLYFHFPHYYETTTPASSLRSGDLKLIHYYEDDRDELYDLAGDPHETRNVAAERPDDARRLRLALDGWLHDMKAAKPKPL